MEKVLLVDELAHLLPDRTARALLAHRLLHLDEEVLLRAENGARPRDSDPSDEVSCGEVIMLHRVEADQGASAAETSLAVHRKG